MITKTRDLLLLAAAVALVAACTPLTTTPGAPTTDQLKARMTNALALANVVFIDADASCSCVVVGISDAAATTAVQSFAASVGVPASSVRTTLTPRIGRFTTLREGVRPIKGGLQVMNNASGTCTMMATVFHRARAAKGLITNSHCTLVQGGTENTDFYQAGGGLFGGDFVARERIDPPFVGGAPDCPSGRRCRRSDAAYAEFTTSTIGIVGRLAQPMHLCTATPCDTELDSTSAGLPVIGVAGQASVGEHRHKIGRATGWTNGTISRDCIDANISNDDGTDTGLTLLCQHVVDAQAAPGDSGSPVFELLQGNRVVLAGILWGGPIGSTGFYVFSALPDIEAEIGAVDFF